ncbi:hypothetical protein OH76DRAFT_223900 [Lentinus brumalis]|uniref:Uncharacterized protein n=1 Tax=Lentinus brumalis TaxID=2498619 RepID=A0A371DH30_9APHY|nr:hypothetical protein OH76DRAFT_223900 [Polyporus brumalis]
MEDHMDGCVRYAKNALYSRRTVTPWHRRAGLEEHSAGSVLVYAKEPLNSSLNCKTPRRHMLVELSVPYLSDVAHCPGLAQPDSRICLRVSAATSVPVPHATRSYASVGTTPGPSSHSTVSLVLTSGG